MTSAHGDDRPPVYLPWSFKSYPNGFHPLLDGLIATHDRVNWLHPESEIHPIQRANKLFVDNVSAMETLRKAVPQSLADEDLVEFLVTRKSEIFMRRPEGCRLTFHHTSPWTNGRTPFILHIENPLTLFSPYLTHGTNQRDASVASRHYFLLVRALLDSPNCRAIFTHIRGTERALRNLFANTSIPDKTRYLPLGVPPLASQISAPKRDVRVLFTNSHHGEARSFYIRGGVAVVRAYLRAAETCPNLHLDLYSRLPSDLDGALRDAITRHPRITLVENHVEEGEIIAAFERCDLFALPSLGLHSMSALRAMAAGAVCIVSDAPGYEEFIVHGQTGLVLRGIAERTYFKSSDCDLLLDNYDWIFSDAGHYEQALFDIFSSAALDPESMRSIRTNARSYIETERVPSVWQDAFLELLAACDQAVPSEGPLLKHQYRPTQADTHQARQHG